MRDLRGYGPTFFNAIANDQFDVDFIGYTNNCLELDVLVDERRVRTRIDRDEFILATCNFNAALLPDEWFVHDRTTPFKLSVCMSARVRRNAIRSAIIRQAKRSITRHLSGIRYPKEAYINQGTLEDLAFEYSQNMRFRNFFSLLRNWIRGRH